MKSAMGMCIFQHSMWWIVLIQRDRTAMSVDLIDGEAEDGSDNNGSEIKEDGEVEDDDVEKG